MLALVSFALLVPTVSPAASWSAEVPAAVVRLGACVRVTSGPFGGATASACCIGKKDGYLYLLTAAHVVPKWEPRVYEFFTEDSQGKPYKSITSGEVVVREPVSDVALVKLSVNDYSPPIIKIAPRGDRPKQFPQLMMALGCPNGSEPQVRLEFVINRSFVRRPDINSAFYWQLATTPTGGMSGGPLVSAKGFVVGVCSAVQDGKGYYAHHDEILYALKVNGHGWLFE